MHRFFLVILKRLLHPVAVFVYLQIVWLAVVWLWVFGFISQNEILRAFAQKLGQEQSIDGPYVMIMVIGCLLLALICGGIIFLFVLSLKQSSFLIKQRAFVSSVTHELRSPLACLQLSFETLQRNDLPEPLRKQLLTMVEDDIERLSSLVDRILISAQLDQRIFSRNQAAEPIKISEFIYKNIEQAKHLDKALLERTRVQCNESLSVRLPKAMLNLILGNLLENAIKFSPEKSPIEISANIDQNQLFLVVKDHGFGLSPKEKRKIFRMFYRSTTAYRKAVNGTGLGLYIVKSTLQLIGGSIAVESAGLHKGAAFNVSIPLKGKW